MKYFLLRGVLVFYMKNKIIAEKRILTQQQKTEILEKYGDVCKTIAYKYVRIVGRGLDFEDLVQAGMMGLLRAAESFDNEKGTKFITYAQFWIKKYILREVLGTERLIRVPEGTYQEFSEIFEIRERLFHLTGREPTADEIAIVMGKPQKAIQAALQFFKKPTSFDANTGDSENSLFIKDTIPDRTPSFIEKNFLKQDLQKIMEKVLCAKDQLIVVLYFGLADGQPKTFQQIANETQNKNGKALTKQAIQLRLENALTKIRKHPEVKDFR